MLPTLFACDVAIVQSIIDGVLHHSRPRLCPCLIGFAICQEMIYFEQVNRTDVSKENKKG